MRELVVLSGKGGTGKTTLTASFAALTRNTVFCDADVDAADLHLLMKPSIKETHDFTGGVLAVLDKDKCSQCGICRDFCRFDAIDETFNLDAIDCEGCGVCAWFCPEEAIRLVQKTCGEWYFSNTRYGRMIHARLGIAEENSGKLVSLIRRKALETAQEEHADLILTDGPPGVGCPVSASLGGATALLIVSEPTVSGLHDLKRVVSLAAHFKVPVFICINKYDLNPDMARTIESYSEGKRIPVVGKIPYDPIFTNAMILGKSVMEYDPDSQVSMSIKEIWQRVISSPEMSENRMLDLRQVAT